MDNTPTVTFVIPTLNEEKFIEQCLKSIKEQDYPADKIEVIIADGGSTDTTLDKVKAYGCIVLNNPERLAEPGKQLAFSKATGKYIALLDADNEIVQPTWLSQAIAALEQYPDALGFESYYLKNKDHSLLNRYLTALLQISDPCAKKITRPLKLVSHDSNKEVFELPKDGSYPTGANGFIFPKKLLEHLPDGGGYHEATFFPRLMKEGIRTLIKIPDCGIYHYYVTSIADFYRKRERAMIIYMLRAESKEENWDSGSGQLRKFLVVLYNATFVGPTIEGLLKAIFSGDPDWLIHPVASLVSVSGNIKGILNYHLLKSDDKRRSVTTDKLSDINRE